MKTDSQFSHAILSGGQPRAYCDSIYKYEVNAPAEADDSAVWEYCQTIAATPNRNNERRQHDGNCGFPFGLSFFGGLWKQGDRWLYSVVHPYCD